MDIKEFLKVTYKEDEFYIRPKIHCVDGFYMSVQGSWGHYSDPRQNSDTFQSVEVGYPSQREVLLIKYADDVNSPTDTVYGYVPITILQSIIDKHGGIDVEKTLKI